MLDRRVVCCTLACRFSKVLRTAALASNDTTTIGACQVHLYLVLPFVKPDWQSP